ncbi:hypothetical protein, partial [Klebsiella pneumoniae]|uniref:hypothetical protein n=1 Tax=Klebsiella pneumoniae TaxID=573 RepID=UPI00345BB21E
MNRDLRRALDDEPMRPFQWLAVAVCIVLNLIDGFDVLVMAFTAASAAMPKRPALSSRPISAPPRFHSAAT